MKPVHLFIFHTHTHTHTHAHKDAHTYLHTGTHTSAHTQVADPCLFLVVHTRNAIVAFPHT